MTFKVGDVVRLRAGGEYMTVAHEADQEGNVFCVWHNPLPKGGHEHRQQTYPSATLILKSELDKQFADGMQGAIDRMDNMGRGGW